MFVIFDQNHVLTYPGDQRFFPPYEELRRPQADRSCSFDRNRKPPLKKPLAPRVGLTPLKICKFFNYSKVTFSLSEKRPFEITQEPITPFQTEKKCYCPLPFSDPVS